jgi:hypothetical protein
MRGCLRPPTPLWPCLIEKFLATSVKDGQTLSDEAHDKTEKLIKSLIEKLPQE